MKIDRNEAFGVCVMSLYGIALAARAIFGDLQSNPATSMNEYIARAGAPIATQSLQLPRTPDNTGKNFERVVKEFTSTP